MMRDPSSQLDRLLRSAASAPSEDAPEMPFGFDTRVLAGWPANRNGETARLTRLLRHVVLVSLGIIALAGAATYRELNETDDLSATFDNEYAIADSAIGSAFEP